MSVFIEVQLKHFGPKSIELLFTMSNREMTKTSTSYSMGASVTLNIERMAIGANTDAGWGNGYSLT